MKDLDTVFNSEKERSYEIGDQDLFVFLALTKIAQEEALKRAKRNLTLVCLVVLLGFSWFINPVQKVLVDILNYFNWLYFVDLFDLLGISIVLTFFALVMMKKRALW